MVKSRKNSLHLEVSNDVDLEYKEATKTSQRVEKGKGKGTKTKKSSLRAKPKRSGSLLLVNGKKIPFKSSKKSGRKKMTSQNKGTKKAYSAKMKRAVSSKLCKEDGAKKKPSKKEGNNVSPALMKKKGASSKTLRPAELLANYFEAGMRYHQVIIDEGERIIVDFEEFKDKVEATILDAEDKKELIVTAERNIFNVKKVIDETANAMKKAERRFKEELTGLLLESEERKN